MVGCVRMKWLFMGHCGLIFYFTGAKMKICDEVEFDRPVYAQCGPDVHDDDKWLDTCTCQLFEFEDDGMYILSVSWIKTLRLRQNGRLFPDNIFTWIFTQGQFWPSGIVVACVCVCVSPCVRQS